MTEVSSQNYFNEEIPADDEPANKQDYNFLSGICNKCLNTGFVHDVRDGVIGILYTTFSEDSGGRPIKQLMVCDHNKTIAI